jgi:hypothetical protein
MKSQLSWSGSLDVCCVWIYDKFPDGNLSHLVHLLMNYFFGLPILYVDDLLLSLMCRLYPSLNYVFGKMGKQE